MRQWLAQRLTLNDADAWIGAMRTIAGMPSEMSVQSTVWRALLALALCLGMSPATAMTLPEALELLKQVKPGAASETAATSASSAAKTSTAVTCFARSVLTPEPEAARADAEPKSDRKPDPMDNTFRFPPVDLVDSGPLVPGGLVRLRMPTAPSLPQSRCLEAADLTLYLGGLPLSGVGALRRSSDDGSAIVEFRIVRPASQMTAWNELLLRSWQAGGTHDVTVGLGTPGIEFTRVPRAVPLRMGAGGASVGLTALAACALLLAIVWRQSGLLLDRRPGHLSYSVSRLLLACWTLTIVACVVLVHLHSGELLSPKDGGLAFMLAIVGASAGGGALIDKLQKASNPSPTSWFDDLFSDADGLAMHRVQVLLLHVLALVVVWTALIQTGRVAGIDSAWAATIGISSLTYLFGKWSEANSPIAARPAA